MADQTIVHYELLAKYSKQFDHEEEILIHSLSELRQKAQMLESEWLGEAADKFFDEFYQEVLPGTERLRLAMQASSETIRKIMNIFDAAENECASYFRDGSLDEGSGGIDVSNLQFGDFRNLGGTPAGSGGIDVSNLDFGDFSNFGSSSPDGSGGSQADPGTKEQDGAFEPQEKEREQEQPENNQSQAGGGGGGGGGSQSGQGDLKMGVGTGNQVGVEGNAGAEGGGAGGMQDHIYEGSSGSGGESNPETNQAGDAGGGQNQPEGGGEFIRAAGMVGGVGAAAGAAARTAKGKKNDD